MSKNCLAHQIHHKLGAMGVKSPGPALIEKVLIAQGKVVESVLTGDQNKPYVRLPGLGSLVSRYPLGEYHKGLKRAAYFFPNHYLAEAVAKSGETAAERGSIETDGDDFSPAVLVVTKQSSGWACQLDGHPETSVWGETDEAAIGGWIIDYGEESGIEVQWPKTQEPAVAAG